MQKMKSTEETKCIQAVLSCISQRLSAFRLHNGSTKSMYTLPAQFTGKNLCENKIECSYKKEPTVQRALQVKCWKEGQQ